MQTLRLLTYNKVGFVGFLVVLAFVFMSIFGPYIVPVDTDVKVEDVYLSPSAKYWLGTDHQGRDVFSYIVNGGRDIIYVAAVAAVLSTLIAVTFGTMGGFLGGWIDTIIVSITDFFLTIPQLPLFAVIAAFINISSLTVLGVMIGVLSWPALLRAVRAQALSLKERDFIEAARALDLGTWHIIFREMIPNMMTYIAISFSLALTGAIYTQVGLVFLGLVPFSSNNWGQMIAYGWVRGAIFFEGSIWYIMSPIVAIAIFQLAVISMTRSLEMLFNPRLRTNE